MLKAPRVQEPMTIKILQLGSPRSSDEGIRIGTVRRPPRGVAKADIARRDYYDVWLPTLSPSAELVSQARAAVSPTDWDRFVRRFKKEMNASDASKVLDLLAVLSKNTNFAIGCYCDEESRCHRGVLRELLRARGAIIQ
jgi:uncharacterized protein YeaO (DUF488 family)